MRVRFDKLKLALGILIVFTAPVLGGCASGAEPGAATPAPGQMETPRGSEQSPVPSAEPETTIAAATTFTVVDPGCTQRDKAGTYERDGAVIVTLSDDATALAGGGASARNGVVTIEEEGVSVFTGDFQTAASL